MSMKRALAALALTTGLFAGCGGGVEPSGNVGQGPAPEGTAVKMEAADNVFEPEKVQIKSGEEIIFEITNVGKIPHDFTIKDLDLSTGVLQPGDVATATFTVPDGDIEYVCTLHRGMKGTIAAGSE